MNKSGILLINILALGLVGCGGSNSIADPAPAPINNDPTSTGGTTEGSTGGTTPSTTTTGGTTPATPTTGGTPGSGGAADIGANPGTLVSPVLADVLSIDVASVGGYKLYAGPEFARNWVTKYANYTFECDGTGSFKIWPTDDLAIVFPIETGTMSWEAEDGDIMVNVVTSTGGESAIFDDSLIGDILDGGAFVVGESTLDSLYVTNILQFEECN